MSRCLEGNDFYTYAMKWQTSQYLLEGNLISVLVDLKKIKSVKKITNMLFRYLNGLWLCDQFQGSIESVFP
jgi:hypothetical protein